MTGTFSPIRNGGASVLLLMRVDRVSLVPRISPVVIQYLRKAFREFERELSRTTSISGLYDSPLIYTIAQRSTAGDPTSAAVMHATVAHIDSSLLLTAE